MKGVKSSPSAMESENPEEEDEKKADSKIWQKLMARKEHYKNYKHFQRGIYSKQAVEDFGSTGQGFKVADKKKKLPKSFDTALRKFNYGEALWKALETKNTDVIVTLLEELVTRDALGIALKNKSPEQINDLLVFLLKKMDSLNHGPFLLRISTVVLDLFFEDFVKVESLQRALAELKKKVKNEMEISEIMAELEGQIALIKSVY